MKLWCPLVVRKARLQFYESFRVFAFSFVNQAWPGGSQEGGLSGGGSTPRTRDCIALDGRRGTGGPCEDAVLAVTVELKGFSCEARTPPAAG